MTICFFLKPISYPIQGIPVAVPLGKRLRKRVRKWKLKLFPGAAGFESPELNALAREQEAEAFDRHVKETTRRWEDEELSLIMLLEQMEDEEQ